MNDDSPYYQIKALVNRGNGRIDALGEKGEYLMSFTEEGGKRLCELIPDLGEIEERRPWLYVGSRTLLEAKEYLQAGTVVKLDYGEGVAPRIEAAFAGDTPFAVTLDFGYANEEVEVTTAPGSVVEVRWDGCIAEDAFGHPTSADIGKPVYVSDWEAGTVTTREVGAQVGILREPGGPGTPVQILFLPE